MPKVSVIIPVVRPEKAARCIAALKADESFRDFEVVSEIDDAGAGCPEMVRRLVDRALGNLVLFLGDDTIPQPGLIMHAMDALLTLPDGLGLVGLNDGIHDGKLATHWLAHKALLPMLDGEFFHTGYRHCFCDRELTDRCRDLGRYAYAEKAVVHHDHPAVTGESPDEYYRRAYDPAVFEADRDLYRRRKIARQRFRVAIAEPSTADKVHHAFHRSFTVMEKRDFVYLYPTFPPYDFPRDIANTRNNLVEQALNEGCTHLIMMDTDQVHPPDTVHKLLSHDSDIVGARVYRRYPPFAPIMLRGEPGAYASVPEPEMFSGDLVPVDATGTGCIMIRTNVFFDIPYPWFEITTGDDGRTIGEDVNFCRKIRSIGKEIYVDTSIDVGHLTTMEINRSMYELYKLMGKGALP